MEIVYREARLAVRDTTGWRPLSGAFGGAWSKLAVADLSGADLTGVNLYGVTLKRVNLRSTNLTRTNLSDAVFRGCDLRGAALAGSCLQGADYDRRTHWPAGFSAQAHEARLVGWIP
jgi:uncharacterized protein YjbI with pentapeptide repeats